MKIGMVGLGRMGSNMAHRLIKQGHQCVVFDLNPANTAKAAADFGAIPASSFENMIALLDPPRAVWLMVPAGEATESSVNAISALMQPADLIIDGGNSYFKDDVRRSTALAQKKIEYVDAGTSGGIWGMDRGYCLMVGGSRKAFDYLEPIFRALAPGLGDTPRTPNFAATGSTAEQGYMYCGPSGSGHFVKMIHNGIEYGLMQAYGEGFDILRNAASTQLAPEYRYDLNVRDISELWRRGSVVQSWLLDLIAMALTEDASLSNFTGFVQDSGEGRWTIVAALEEAVPADVLAASLFTRFRSRQDHTFAEKVLSAMRNKFGGHIERPAGG